MALKRVSSFKTIVLSDESTWSIKALNTGGVRQWEEILIGGDIGFQSQRSANMYQGWMTFAETSLVWEDESAAALLPGCTLTAFTEVWDSLPLEDTEKITQAIWEVNPRLKPFYGGELPLLENDSD